MRRVVPSESLTVSPSRSTSTTVAPSCISTPIFCSRAWAFFPRLAPIGAQHRRPRVEQDHPRLCRVDMAECAFQRLGGQLGDLARQLHPGRTRTDDGERQQLLAEDRIAGPFRQLERAEDAPAHFERVVDRLHAGRELREMVVAEIGLAGAGRDDQAVVRRLVALPEQL